MGYGYVFVTENGVIIGFSIRNYFFSFCTFNAKMCPMEIALNRVL